MHGYSQENVARSVDRRAKASRVSHCKVRTGCITCKKRRVKCDESRPGCSRCAKIGVQCLGYEAVTPVRDTAHQSRAASQHPAAKGANTAIEGGAPACLRPRAVQRKIVQLDGIASLLMLSPNPSPVKLSSSDVVYFDMSRNYILQDMRRWSYVGFFDQHVLRQAMHDDCIRHAVLALSAMCKATQSVHKQQQQQQQSRQQQSQAKWAMTAKEFLAGQHRLYLSTKGDHYNAALAHYVESTALCRNKLANLNEDTLPTVIIATYIFTVLEMLQGNVDAMGRLLSYNDALLKMKKRTRKPQDDLGKDANPRIDMDAELGDMFHHLSIKCALFPYYNNQRLLYTELLPAEIAPVPTDATPFELVRKAWERTIRPIQRYFICLPFMAAKGAAALDDCREVQSAYITHATQWRQLVDHRLASGPDPRARQELRAMKIDILVTLIYLECSLDESGSMWDTKREGFREAADLMEKVARDTSSKHIKFLYEFRLFPTIALLITKCRDWTIRQRALDMLVELLSRDTRWSGVILVKGLQTIIDLEEEQRGEDGVIPIALRYNWIGSRWDYESNELVMKLKRGDGLSVLADPSSIDLAVQV
ncbi:hypothetical protein BX600DRAFT_439134 [Xylariales sp. PMI_506]|nr:hypothetical protein BX600DRAFT_439134 [Xylariales sp. PMI_506]